MSPIGYQLESELMIHPDIVKLVSLFANDARMKSGNNPEKVVSSRIVFAERVLKYNEYKIKQERFLVLTEDHVLSLKQKKYLRRSVPIKQLQGITINLTNNNEMVLHINREKDVRFLITKRKQFVDALKVLYL